LKAVEMPVDTSQSLYGPKDWVALWATGSLLHHQLRTTCQLLCVCDCVSCGHQLKKWWCDADCGKEQCYNKIVCVWPGCPLKLFDERLNAVRMVTFWGSRFPVSVCRSRGQNCRIAGNLSISAWLYRYKCRVSSNPVSSDLASSDLASTPANRTRRKC
jgi:hypothetical protein